MKIIFLEAFIPPQTRHRYKAKYFSKFRIFSYALVNSAKNSVILKILAVLQCLVNIPRLRDFYYVLFLPLRGKKRADLVPIKISVFVNISNSIFL